MYSPRHTKWPPIKNIVKRKLWHITQRNFVQTWPTIFPTCMPRIMICYNFYFVIIVTPKFGHWSWDWRYINAVANINQSHNYTFFVWYGVFAPCLLVHCLANLFLMSWLVLHCGKLFFICFMYIYRKYQMIYIMLPKMYFILSNSS